MTAGLEREAVVGLLPIRALIVHAEDSPQRVENVRRLTAYLAGVGLEAVDVFPAVRPPDPGPLYSAGEFGCYQSHGHQSSADSPSSHFCRAPMKNKPGSRRRH